MKRLLLTLAVCALGSGLGVLAAQEGPARPSPSPRAASPSPNARPAPPASPTPPVASHPRPPVAPSLAPIRPEDAAKILYAVGFVLGRETAVFALTPAEAEQVTKGFADSLAGTNPQFPLETYGPQIQSLAQARQARKAEVEKGVPIVREEPPMGRPFPRARLVQRRQPGRRRTMPLLRQRTRWDPAR